jgi:hypothetical protein
MRSFMYPVYSAGVLLSVVNPLVHSQGRHAA